MKTLQIIFALFLSATFSSQAQLMNTGFEDLNADGSIQYWGFTKLQAIMIDSNGVAHYDSIVIDQQYCQSSNDAHTGNRAMEIRNAYNYTLQQGISGGGVSSFDTVQTPYTGFVPITGRPQYFSFYYKYFPVGNDTGYAYIQILDSNSNEIAYNEILIPNQATSYTHMNVPINYSSSDMAAVAFIQFRASYNDTMAHLGTRFLIDDVSLGSPNSMDDKNTTNQVIAFPNPVPHVLAIRSELPIQEISIQSFHGQTLYHHYGEIAFIDCNQFANGVYLLHIKTSKGIQSSRLTVQH